MGMEGGESDGEGVGWHGENVRGRTGGERMVLAPENVSRSDATAVRRIRRELCVIPV